MICPRCGSFIDAGKSPEELCKAMLTYFATLHFF